MYPHFIEITPKVTGNKVSVNVENIVMIGEGQVICTNMDMKGNSGAFWCTETYDELKQLIESSGCLINMGDPRLDHTHQLTKEDIKEMEANEPIWNSNDREWYQIANWSDLNDFTMTLQNIHRIIRVDEKDLIATPFYRMRQ